MILFHQMKVEHKFLYENCDYSPVRTMHMEQEEKLS